MSRYVWKIQEEGKLMLPDVELPQDPGLYLWNICDLGYFDIGVVRIALDPETHIAGLREREKTRTRENPLTFYLYENKSGVLLTMYHQAHDHLPPCDKDGKPWVDGYRKTSYDYIWGKSDV